MLSQMSYRRSITLYNTKRTSWNRTHKHAPTTPKTGTTFFSQDVKLSCWRLARTIHERNGKESYEEVPPVLVPFYCALRSLLDSLSINSSSRHDGFIIHTSPTVKEKRKRGYFALGREFLFLKGIWKPEKSFIKPYRIKNKAVYTAASVACGWAGAV